MTHRNSILHLLEIYEMLMQGKQTFNGIRHQTRLGYHSLRSLLDRLVEHEFVYESQIGENISYEATEKLIDLFRGNFYKGVNELKDL